MSVLSQKTSVLSNPTGRPYSGNGVVDTLLRATPVSPFYLLVQPSSKYSRYATPLNIDAALFRNSQNYITV